MRSFPAAGRVPDTRTAPRPLRAGRSRRANSHVSAQLVRLESGPVESNYLRGVGGGRPDELDDGAIVSQLAAPPVDSVQARPMELGESVLDSGDVDAMMAHQPMGDGDLATPVTTGTCPRSRSSTTARSTSAKTVSGALPASASNGSGSTPSAQSLSHSESAPSPRTCTTAPRSRYPRILTSRHSLTLGGHCHVHDALRHARTGVRRLDD